MKRETWIEIVKIVANAIIAVIAALTVSSCTATMSISKYNNSSPQSVEQSTTASADSASINIKP